MMTYHWKKKGKEWVLQLSDAEKLEIANKQIADLQAENKRLTAFVRKLSTFDTDWFLTTDVGFISRLPARAKELLT